MWHSRDAMKPTLFLVLAFPCLLGAQEVSKDPFVKDKKATTSKSTVAEVPANVSCLIETITLPKAAYAALIDQPKDREALHSRVLDSVKAGSAVLDGCHFLITRPGARASNDSTDELIYPSQWNTAYDSGYQYPSAFEMYPLGDKFEMEPTMNERGGGITFNQSLTRQRFMGFRSIKADAGDSGALVPEFFHQGGATGHHGIPGVPALVASWASAGSDSMTLVFATPQVVLIQSPAKAVEPGAGNIHATARVISIERRKGWDLLRKHPQDASACYPELAKLVSSNEAVLEHVSTIVTVSGARALHESGRRYYYGTEFDYPRRARGEDPEVKAAERTSTHSSPAGVRSFECRELGFRWEMETTLNVERSSHEMNVSFGCTTLVGLLKDPLWTERYPEMPLFSEQRITTGFTQANGSVVLVGTLNPPGDTGANERKDTGRMWLLFFETNLE